MIARNKTLYNLKQTISKIKVSSECGGSLFVWGLTAL
jgi:hypothetical protein